MGIFKKSSSRSSSTSLSTDSSNSNNNAEGNYNRNDVRKAFLKMSSTERQAIMDKIMQDGSSFHSASGDGKSLSRRRSSSNTNGGKQQQLRAKSFFRKELAGQRDSAQFLELMQNAAAAAAEDQDDDSMERTVELLEANVQRLTEKCAALESQNILIAVQQLDMLAQGIAYTLSFAILLLYWKLILWCQPYLLQSAIWLEEQRFVSDDSELAYYYQLLMQVLQYPLTLYFFQGMLMVFPYFYNQRTHGSMKRRFEVFAIFFILLGRIKLCRWRERTFVQSGNPTSAAGTTSIATVPRYGESCTDDGIWDANYEISARFLYLSIFRLRGLWTKTAQYLSSRADFVPVSYIRELSKLQDQAPATPWEEVERLLSPKLLSELTDIEKKPLASASIGQVHVARLKSTNEKVVIKVQHPHARTLMTDDFWSLKTICRIVAWLEPDYGFMEVLMREWATEARKELDFTFEAENMVEADRALQNLALPGNDVVYTSSLQEESEEAKGEGTPFQVLIPTPIHTLCNRDVLVMNFCEGCRVDDFDQIEEWNLSRSAIMDGISQTFAHLMYCSTIFNGDPHPGNILVRPGIRKNDKDGFTLILLDWGLAKRLPVQKRVAFCQMVYAAATFDYGLLLDSYKTVGLKMKREDAGQSMEDMRFFLRDMAPREETRNRIKKKMKADTKRFKENNEKVPMESKAYPGEFFFFIRVNELIHGLGGRYSINLSYLDLLRPYAERGLRESSFYDLVVSAPKEIQVNNATLQNKLESVLSKLEKENKLVGGQVCVLDKTGSTEASIVAGSLGGLRSHIPMTSDAVILGFSTTKAVTATIAHLMVLEGYITYDEPVCERVWEQFCPTKDPPKNLPKALGLPLEDVKTRWQWKRQISLRHFLNHTSGLWSSLPTKLTLKKLASCEQCFASYEVNLEKLEETLLPTCEPGTESQYHYLSFGWLVAGALCGAYAVKEKRSDVTFKELYERFLEPKLSQRTKDAGFYPTGGFGDKLPAQTVTTDVRASTIMQKRRESVVLGEDNDGEPSPVMKALERFQGKEFLLDPRIWNSQDVLTANVPAAGGRFSAEGLASFYHDLSQGNLLPKSMLDDILCTESMNIASEGNALQGVTRITNAANDASAQTKLTMGYQRIRTDRDPENNYRMFGHAGVGGSIGFWHIETGLCVGLMLNKSDGDMTVTKEILHVIADHYQI